MKPPERFKLDFPRSKIRCKPSMPRCERYGRRTRRLARFIIASMIIGIDMPRLQLSGWASKQEIEREKKEKKTKLSKRRNFSKILRAPGGTLRRL